MRVHVPIGTPLSSSLSTCGRPLLSVSVGSGLLWCWFSSQPWEDPHAASLDPEVVESANVGHTAQFDDFERQARDAEVVDRLLQADDPVREALDMRVGVARSSLIQQQQRATTPDEELLQAE